MRKIPLWKRIFAFVFAIILSFSLMSNGVASAVVEFTPPEWTPPQLMQVEDATNDWYPFDVDDMNNPDSTEYGTGIIIAVVIIILFIFIFIGSLLSPPEEEKSGLDAIFA